MNSKYLIVISLSVLFYVLLVNAWICDDAYITLRTADNFVNGYGLTWNVTERVQAYTHPLWMLLLSFFYFFTRNAFLTPIILSIALSFVAMYILIKYIANDKLTVMLLFFLMIYSKSFIDYTTSGLENPLSYILLITCYYLFFSVDSKKRLLLMSLLSSMAILNRFDLALLFIPPLIYVIFNTKHKKIIHLVYGFLPLAGWFLFSLIYYGFLLPNTAYAKLNAGIPQSDYFEKGFQYFINSLQNDPLTLMVILLAFVISIYNILKVKDFKYIAPASSIILYNIYILYIGGDFMSGRFFSVPFALALIIIAYYKIEVSKNNFRSFYKLLPFLVVIVIGMFQIKSPIYSGVFYGYRKNLKIDNNTLPFSDKNLITDERAYYYQYNSFLRVVLKGKDEPVYPMIDISKLAAANAPLVINAHMVGIFGYYIGRQNYVVDELALTDAFLSRLPQEYKPNWRIGHIQRIIPEGYLQSIIEKKNLLADDNLREYYGYIRKIISGNIFDWERIKIIVNMNLGNYNHLLSKDYTISSYPVLTSGDSNSLCNYYYNLSLYHYYTKNDVKKALYFASKSISYNPDSNFVCYKTGAYYQDGMNRQNNLLNYTGRAVRLNKRYIDAYKALADFYTELGLTDSANYYLQISNLLNSNNDE